MLLTADLLVLWWTVAVIDAAMRLHPSAYMTRRAALCAVELAGHRLPGKSIMRPQSAGHPAAPWTVGR